jgi:hypothetical protein
MLYFKLSTALENIAINVDLLVILGCCLRIPQNLLWNVDIINASVVDIVLMNTL